MERPSNKKNDQRCSLNSASFLRIRMEHMTMNAITGSIASARMSAWFCGGSSGWGNFSAARVAIKMAPTPTTQASGCTPISAKALTGTKVAREEGLLEGMHIWYPLVKHDHDRESPQQNDENSKNDKPPDCHARSLRVKCIKWHPSPDIHEDCDVEKKINDRRKDGILCVLVEV